MSKLIKLISLNWGEIINVYSNLLYIPTCCLNVRNFLTIIFLAGPFSLLLEHQASNTVVSGFTWNKDKKFAYYAFFADLDANCLGIKTKV